MNHITKYTALDVNINKTIIVSANKDISRFYTMKQNSKLQFSLIMTFK